MVNKILFYCFWSHCQSTMPIDPKLPRLTMPPRQKQKLLYFYGTKQEAKCVPTKTITPKSNDPLRCVVYEKETNSHLLYRQKIHRNSWRSPSPQNVTRCNFRWSQEGIDFVLYMWNAEESVLGGKKRTFRRQLSTTQTQLIGGHRTYHLDHCHSWWKV